MTIWATDAHPWWIAAIGWCKKDMKINKNLPQTGRAWIFKRLCNLWKRMQIDKANNTREDCRECRLPVIYKFYNRLRSLHVDALIGAHPAEMCSSQNQGDWAAGEKPQPPEPHAPSSTFAFHGVTHNYPQHPRPLNMNAACHVQVPCVPSFK